MKNLALLLLFAATAAHAAITGTVFDRDGKPIGGASVRAYAAEEGTAFRARVASGKADREPLATAKTNDDGTFSIDPGKQRAADVVIEAAGHAPSTIPTVDGDDLGAIVLGPASALHKVRVTSGGKPVANALIVHGSAVTRTNGTEEPSIPMALPIYVVHPDYAVAPWRPSAAALAAGAGIDVRLTRGVAITGRVVNAAGPVAHATVSVDGWPLAESGDDGSFSIAHAPERWTLLTARRGSEGGSLRRGTRAAEVRIAPLPSLAVSVREAKSGAAVAAARLTLTPSEFDLDEPSQTVVTDARGNAVFPAVMSGTYTIRGIHPAAAIEFASVRLPDQRTRTLAAQPATRVSGHVLDEEKKPIAGALVSAPGGAAMRGRNAMTNAAGEFVTHAEPPVGMSVTMPLLASKSGYVTASTAVALQPGGSRDDVTFVLPRGFVKEVRLVDARQQPVAAASVNILRSSDDNDRRPVIVSCAEAGQDCRHTDAAGVVRIRTVEGKHEVVAAGEDIVMKRLPAVMITAKDEPLTVTVERAVTLSGRVVRPDGSPVADATVQTAENAQQRTAVTDAGGAFTLTGLASGPLTLTAQTPDRRLSSLPLRTEAPGKDVTITMPRGGRIEGRVFERDTQQPVRDFSITATPVRQPLRGGPASDEIHSDDGRFVIDAVAPGLVQLSVRASGYAVATRADITLDDGKTVTGIDVPLDRGATLTGRVTSGGAAVEGAQVTVGATRAAPTRDRSSDGAATTDADGRYTIEGLQAGERSVTVTKTGYVTAQALAEVTPGKETRYDVQLELGRELHGTVVDKSGKPVANAMVSVSSTYGRPAANASSDADGAFTLQGLGEGKYHLWARRQGYVTGELTDVDVPQARPVVVTLDSGGTVSGRVSGVTTSASRIVVTASGGSTHSQATVDANGGFTLHGVPDGRVLINAIVESPERPRRTTKEIQVQNGSAPFVEMVFDEGLTVRGRVTRGGVPVTGGISFTSKQPLQQSGDSTVYRGANGSIGADGTYIVDGLTAGEYRVNITSLTLSYETSYTVAGSSTFDIDVRGATLRGRVVSAAGDTPVAGARVNIMAPRAPGWNVVTDSDGRFVIDALPDGTHELVVQREGFPSKRQSVTVAGGTAPDVVVRLDNTAPTTIRVTDAASGAPVEANVFVDDAAHTQGQGAMHSDVGVYKVWLPAGHFSAIVAAPGYVRETVPFDVPAPEVRVALNRGGQLAVRAGSEQRLRIRQPGATEGQLIVGVHRGTNGPFQPMRPGTYVVETLGRTVNEILRTATVVIVPGEVVTIDIP